MARELAAWISWDTEDLSDLRRWGVVLATAHGMRVGRWSFSSEKLGYIDQNGERMLEKNHSRCLPQVC